MPEVRLIRLSGIEQIGDDRLRTEADAWARYEYVEVGVAVCVPDDGKPMEGIFLPNSKIGMVIRGIDPPSEWIRAKSLHDLFHKCAFEELL